MSNPVNFPPLGPLPEKEKLYSTRDHFDDPMHIMGHTDEAMQAYGAECARQAVEANRAQRGVPEVLALAKSMLEGWVDSFVDCIEGGEADEMVLATRSIIEKLGSLIAAAPTASQQAAKCYVHQVPDHCDRITWRGGYYLLENLTSTAHSSSASNGKGGPF